MRLTSLVLAAALLAGCGGDASGPSRSDAAGTYFLTTLAFDPQGVLPEVDILARVGGDVPRLVLAPGGEAQLVFEDPATGLITIANGTYSTPQSGVRVDFGATTTYSSVLLSRRMTFDAGSGGTLTFQGTAPDGVARQRLLQLVPEFAGEQLLDPVPGELTVVFTRSQ
ncbi:MAG TPA: hypothetical protein VK936_05575 [Longimicrobiales bacterium]|nr:hypothetical protein [Longimicrobiales bacterium]